MNKDQNEEPEEDERPSPLWGLNGGIMYWSAKDAPRTEEKEATWSWLKGKS